MYVHQHQRESNVYFLNPYQCANRVAELYGRDPVRSSTRISNPGCYATSSQLLLAPLIRASLISPTTSSSTSPTALPTIFGISGYSGAGTVAGAVDADGRPATVPKVTPESLGGGVKPYALTDHIHEREAGFHLSSLLPSSEAGKVKLAFTPAVAPWFSGILSVLSAQLTRKVTAKEIKELYEEMYAGERLIKVGSKVPEVGDVEGIQGWTVGGFQVHSEGERVVVVVSGLIDFDAMTRD